MAVQCLLYMLDLEHGSGTAEKAKVGSADFLIELENRRAMKVSFFLVLFHK